MCAEGMFCLKVKLGANSALVDGLARAYFCFPGVCLSVYVRFLLRRGGVPGGGAPQGGQAAQGPVVEWRLGSGRLREPTMSLFTPQQSARWSVQIINRDL